MERGNKSQTTGVFFRLVQGGYPAGLSELAWVPWIQVVPSLANSTHVTPCTPPAAARLVPSTNLILYLAVVDGPRPVYGEEAVL